MFEQGKVYQPHCCGYDDIYTGVFSAGQINIETVKEALRLEKGTMEIFHKDEFFSGRADYIKGLIDNLLTDDIIAQVKEQNTGSSERIARVQDAIEQPDKVFDLLVNREKTGKDETAI